MSRGLFAGGCSPSAACFDACSPPSCLSPSRLVFFLCEFLALAAPKQVATPFEMVEAFVFVVAEACLADD